MIRINLLSEGKRPTAVRKARAGGGLTGREDFATILMLAVIALGILAAAGWWWQTKGDLEEKRAEVAAAQQERDRLQEVIAEVERFKAKKAELNHKIEVINQLKANQRGPVRVMDHVSNALPELLWIDQMTMRPDTITLQGRAFNLPAVANFIESLEAVPEFREPERPRFTRQGQVFRYEFTFPYTYEPLLPAAADVEVEVDPAAATTPTGS